MSRKTVTVFAAPGSAGSACVEELLPQDVFNVQVLTRAGGLQEKSSSGLLNSVDTKQQPSTWCGPFFWRYLRNHPERSRAAHLAS